MFKRRWKFHVDGEAHEVVVKFHEEGMFELRCDGLTVSPPGTPWEAFVDGDHRFYIGERVVALHCRPWLFIARFDLSVDGVSVVSGRPPAPASSRAQTRRGVSLALIVGGVVLEAAAFALGHGFGAGDFPSRYLGVVVAVAGLLGLFGVNVFRGGFLDRGND